MLMKSSDASASGPERDSARRMAEKLMKKNGISEADLAGPDHDVTPVTDWTRPFGKSFSDF